MIVASWTPLAKLLRKSTHSAQRMLSMPASQWLRSCSTQKSAGYKSALEPSESGFQNGELRSIAKPAAKRELFFKATRNFRSSSSSPQSWHESQRASPPPYFDIVSLFSFFFLLYLIFSDRSHTFRSAKRWSCRWKVASGFSLFRADSTAALRSCVVIGHRRNHTAKKNKKASLKLAHPNTQHSALIRIWRKKYEWMKLSKIFSFFTLERLKLPATYRSDSLFFFWSKKISHTRDSDGDFNLQTIFRLFGGTFMESHKHSAALAQESRLQFNSLFRH